MSMKNLFRAVALIAVLILTLLTGSMALAASPQAGQCPSGGVKTDTSDGSIVLPAGLTACFKAGNGNTGLVVTDGVSTIAQYIEASGLLNDGGQVPSISNYVVYEEATPSTEPTPTPSPSDSPTPTPTPSASPTPSVTPLPTPSVEPTPTPPVRTPLPPTDTVSGTGSSDLTPLFAAIGIVAVAFCMADVIERRRSRR